MITRDFIEQDRLLQRYAATPQDKKPRYDWAGSIREAQTPCQNALQVRVGGQTRAFDLAEIADTVGNAVTDLALSRNQEDIFTEDNRRLVSVIAEAVARDLADRAMEGGGSAREMTSEEITEIIERVLIRHNAHDVAKSLVIRRKTAGARQAHHGSPKTGELGLDLGKTKPLCKVIRRTGEVVAWNPNKIEVAVRSAFLSMGCRAKRTTTSMPCVRTPTRSTDACSHRVGVAISLTKRRVFLSIFIGRSVSSVSVCCQAFDGRFFAESVRDATKYVLSFTRRGLCARARALGVRRDLMGILFRRHTSAVFSNQTAGH